MTFKNLMEYLNAVSSHFLKLKRIKLIYQMSFRLLWKSQSPVIGVRTFLTRTTKFHLEITIQRANSRLFTIPNKSLLLGINT